MEKAQVAKKILYFVSEDWAFCSHRLPLAVAAKAAGYDVVVVTRVQRHGKQIEAAGLRLISIDFSRRGLNPIHEIAVLLRLFQIYRSEAPHLVHHVALKPVLYGSIVAWLARVPVIVNAYTGLGFLFISSAWHARVLKRLAATVLGWLSNRSDTCAIFQNPDDMNLLMEMGVAKPGHTALIRGSGVDTYEFCPYPEPDGMPVVILASRMLWDKGVGEFVQASKQLKLEGIAARFALVGDTDPENPAAIMESQLNYWQQQGVIEWWGNQNDMAAVMKQAHVVCLPSYREGLPKVLLEAASCGKPIVTTDVPGCREIVHHGVNGFLVEKADMRGLAEALKLLISDSALRARMGSCGRAMVEAEFSLERIVQQTLAVYGQLH